MKTPKEIAKRAFDAGRLSFLTEFTEDEILDKIAHEIKEYADERSGNYLELFNFNIKKFRMYDITLTIENTERKWGYSSVYYDGQHHAVSFLFFHLYWMGWPFTEEV